MQKINEFTTYSELKGMVPDARGRKMQGKTLIRSDEPILISLKQDSATITVYQNGFFAYQDDQGRVTARAVWNCTEMVFEQAVGRSESITEDVFGELPFPVVLSHFGERNIAHQIEELGAYYGDISLNGENVIETEELSTQDFANEVCERLDGGEPEKSRYRKMVEAVPGALEKLTDRQREVFLLYYREGLTQTQIAEKLGIRQQVAQKILKAAKNNFKKFYS